MLLAYAYVNAASTGLDLSTVTDIPGLECVVELPDNTDIKVDFSLLVTRAAADGAVRIILEIDGVQFDYGGSPQPFYALYLGENSVFTVKGSFILPVLAGSRTITLRASDALSNRITTFYARSMTVEAMIPASFVTLSAAEYAALSPPDANTYYFVEE